MPKCTVASGKLCNSLDGSSWHRQWVQRGHRGRPPRTFCVCRVCADDWEPAPPGTGLGTGALLEVAWLEAHAAALLESNSPRRANLAECRAQGLVDTDVNTSIPFWLPWNPTHPAVQRLCLYETYPPPPCEAMGEWPAVGLVEAGLLPPHFSLLSGREHPRVSAQRLRAAISAREQAVAEVLPGILWNGPISQ